MRQQIVLDIIRLMRLKIHINNVQTLIREAYGVNVQAHGIWKVYHTARGL